MSEARTINPTPFSDDDGSADPHVRQAIADAETGTPAAYLTAVAALCQARVLLAVTPIASDRPSSAADMAVVLMRTGPTELALLGFTGLDSFQAWAFRAARPIPATLDRVAAAATAEGARTVVIDIAGPVPIVIEGDVLEQLAAGHRLVALPEGEFGWLQPTP